MSLPSINASHRTAAGAPQSEERHLQKREIELDHRAKTEQGLALRSQTLAPAGTVVGDEAWTQWLLAVDEGTNLQRSAQSYGHSRAIGTAEEEEQRLDGYRQRALDREEERRADRGVSNPGEVELIESLKKLASADLVEDVDPNATFRRQSTRFECPGCGGVWLGLISKFQHSCRTPASPNVLLSNRVPFPHSYISNLAPVSHASILASTGLAPVSARATIVAHRSALLPMIPFSPLIQDVLKFVLPDTPVELQVAMAVDALVFALAAPPLTGASPGDSYWWGDGSAKHGPMVEKLANGTSDPLWILICGVQPTAEVVRAAGKVVPPCTEAIVRCTTGQLKHECAASGKTTTGNIKQVSTYARKDTIDSIWQLPRDLLRRYCFSIFAGDKLFEKATAAGKSYEHLLAWTSSSASAGAGASASASGDRKSVV